MKPPQRVRALETLHEIPLPDGTVFRLLERKLFGSRELYACIPYGRGNTAECVCSAMDGQLHWMTFVKGRGWASVRALTEDETRVVRDVKLPPITE